jgi:hypothetical protein
VVVVLPILDAIPVIVLIVLVGGAIVVNITVVVGILPRVANAVIVEVLIFAFPLQLHLAGKDGAIALERALDLDLIPGGEGRKASDTLELGIVVDFHCDLANNGRIAAMLPGGHFHDEGLLVVNYPFLFGSWWRPLLPLLASGVLLCIGLKPVRRDSCP